MSDPNAYVMLISSLPKPEPIFVAKQTPLSRLKLDQRLRVLPPGHAAVLHRVEEALRWDHLPIELSDADVVDRGRKALAQIDNEVLTRIIRDRLEIRTCVAALRRRLRGETAPATGMRWGVGRWVHHIARYWTEPTFRLDGVFPWLREADRLLKDGDSLALERLLLQESWQKLVRQAGEHQFDFEAVVIYVLKWNIVNRWTKYNSEAAARRFQDLTDAGLGRFAALTFTEQS